MIKIKKKIIRIRIFDYRQRSFHSPIKNILSSTVKIKERMVIFARSCLTTNNIISA
jgi:hypothetical protein